ncbi:MAG: hypothetical protein IT285_12940 [Bdellovibrionales bacterium]|nr:hypothetical protein [Bdellovibrionales bacterium]
MKSSFHLMLIAGLITGFSATAQAAFEEVLVPVDHVYSPKGFDSNDDAEVIVSGILPDLCYKAPRGKVQLDGDTLRVTVTALKEMDPNVACPRAIVPFIEVVSVGVLDAGQYPVVVNGGPLQVTSRLGVEEASSSAVDNYIYARVESVERVPGTRTVQLKGFNPSYCFEFERVELVSNDADTFSVLPILKQRTELCPLKLVPFTYEVEIPTTLARDEILLHVRVMNGRSVNSVFQNK